MSVETAVAIVTAVAALGAALAALWQVKLSRFSLGVDLLSRLDERFESEEFRRKRSTAAHALGRAITSDSKGQVEDVLDFFETVGLLVRRKALDREMAYSTFFHVLYGYWLSAKGLIETWQQEHPEVYKDLVWLKDALVRVAKNKGETIEAEEWSNFLDEEVLPPQ